MFCGRKLRESILLFFSKSSSETFCNFQKANYVDVSMRWKKDPFFDSVDILSKAGLLRPLCSLKNIIIKKPDRCIPISAPLKRGREFEISGRVAIFLRRYPAVFEEFRDLKHSLPWFRLTQELIDVDQEEREIYLRRGPEIFSRLRRLILMSKRKMLLLRIIQGML
ncbi:hypothetical protein KSP39_PZI001602 [Platanthera zijinensis]|uniref:PORR domain-containing protein n=1 Tax=Platanthera zijinensis TaxID=2320716 RepID=A0AAP0GEB1_9ASPA